MLTFLGLLAIVLWDYYHSASGRADVFDSRADRRPGRASDRRAVSIVDLPGAVRRLCHQGAAVSAAHLAAAGPRAGADGRQRDPGRHPAEDRHLRLRCGSACRCCPTPRPLCMPWLLWLVGGRHHLRRAGGPGPDRHEAADRLFQRQPPGLLHAGPVRAQRAGRAKGACCR